MELAGGYTPVWVLVPEERASTRMRFCFDNTSLVCLMLESVNSDEVGAHL